MKGNTPQLATAHGKVAKSIKRLLKPIVKALLRNGFSYQQFNDWVKEVFVVSASEVLSENQQKPSTSSISVMTGLNRKDVAAWRNALAGSDLIALSASSNRAMKVVSAWSRLIDSDNSLTTLPLKAADATNVLSFESLCKAHSGDMPAKAVQEELARLDMISLDKQGVTLIKQEYIPSNDLSDLFRILSVSGIDLITTIEHNIKTSHTNEASRLQLSVAYDELPDSVVAEFKTLSEAKALELIKTLDTWLAQHASDAASKPTTPTAENTNRAGMGIYFFNND